ncbi:MAG: hypothetical protein HYZ19_01690 [Rhodocyclales bacterium]|nr:hypothetical protein [Rhodocyclales bacterium]
MRPTRPTPSGRRRLLPGAAGAAAIAGLLTAWAALFGPQAAFPPAQTLDWLPWLTVGALLILAVGARPAFPAALRWPLRLAVLGAGLWLLTPPLLRGQDATTLGGEVGAAFVLGALLLAAARRRAYEPEGGASVLAALAAALGSLGFVTALGGSLVLGGLTTAASAIAALAWLALLAGRLPPPGAAAIAAAVAFWAWLAYSARHLAEIPAAETLLSAAALAAVLVPLRLGGKGFFQRAFATLLAPALPALAAAAVAVWRYATAQSY